MFQSVIETANAVPAEIGASCDALFDLGMMFSTGQDGMLDLVAAHKWFNLAALKGRVDALSHRRELAELMSDADIAMAQREARIWMTSH